MSAGTKKQEVEARAAALLDPLVRAEGFELVDLEYVKEQPGWILRIFIDRPNRDPLSKEGGVGLEECSLVSHAVDTSLDVEDFIEHEYTLEVSSPGLNRPLRKREHFERVRGQRIKVKTFGPIGEPPRKSFTGELKEVAEDAVTVGVEGAGEFRIPLKDVAKANLEFEF